MPFPLIPFAAGAAVGALTTYLLIKKTASLKSDAYKGVYEPYGSEIGEPSDPGAPSSASEPQDKAT